MSPVRLPGMSSAKMLMAVAMAGLSRLLPGDLIHDQAPISRRRRDYAAEAEAIKAAEAKRQRKQQRRLLDAAVGGWRR